MLPIKYVLPIIAVVAFIGSVYWVHTLKVEQAVEKTKVEMNAQYQKKLDKVVAESIEKERKMVADSNKNLKDKNEQIKSIDARLNAALSKLRKRPSRTPSTDNPKDTKDNTSCTARELYREDAEFLTREAARADSILSERDYYYREYESVRRNLEENSTEVGR